MSSGTSTPRTASTTPTPPGDPSPLTVGTRFVKQYYKVLSTTPEQIVRFYQPATSVVTVGTGSDPAVDVPDIAEAAARFHQTHDADGPVRFEFEHGAIDAQVSVNAGVLLAVTGHMVHVSTETRKAFVHTFFLGSTTSGQNSNKRSYYVHNDILRFLHQEEENGAKVQKPDVVIASVEQVAAAATAVVEEDVKEMEPPMPVLVEEVSSGVDADVGVEFIPVHTVEKEEEAVVALAVETAIADLIHEEAPGNGVEESKEVVLEDNDDVTATTTTKKKAAVPPGSWASLVARKPAVATPPATPNRLEKGNHSNNKGTNTSNSAKQAPTPVKAAPEPALPVPTVTTTTTTSAAETNNINSSKPPQTHQPRQSKRDPDCTLVIKNIDANVTEAEIRALFEPFTADTTATVIGCTVQAHRGIAFVDYDSAEPVLKAVKQQTEVTAFAIRDRKLEIYQKTVEQRNRSGGGSARGAHRGGYRGGSGGGRDVHQSRGGGEGRGDGGRGGDRNFRRGTGGRSSSGRDARGGGRAPGAAAPVSGG